MGWMNLTRDEQRTMLAKRLGYCPESPETWQTQTIDCILDEAEKLAERHIVDQIHYIGGKDASWHMEKK